MCRSHSLQPGSGRHHGGVAEKLRDDGGRAWIAWINEDNHSASLQGGLADPNIDDGASTA